MRTQPTEGVTHVVTHRQGHRVRRRRKRADRRDRSNTKRPGRPPMASLLRIRSTGSGTSWRTRREMATTGRSRTPAGQREVRGALSFNGTSARVNVPDAASLQLTSGMTLEAWVNPATVTSGVARRDLQGRRQLLPGGDHRLGGRPAGGRASSAAAMRTRTGRLRCRRTRGRIWR